VYNSKVPNTHVVAVLTVKDREKIAESKNNIFYQIRGQYFINMSHYTIFSTTEERNIKCTV